MGKYALLLAQLIKLSSKATRKDFVRSFVKLECVKTHEVDDLIATERIIKFHLRHGNDLLPVDCIRESDVNLKEQGRLLRQDEFTVYQEKTKKIRYVFLFEDLILFSKAKGDPERKNLESYAYKNSYKMSEKGITVRPDGPPNSFEIGFRKQNPQNTRTFLKLPLRKPEIHG
ncbi:puratrophin-1-like [Artemia franciscana]